MGKFLNLYFNRLLDPRLQNINQRNENKTNRVILYLNIANKIIRTIS